MSLGLYTVGECSTNVYTGRLRPEVQPPTLLYTFFYVKGTLFVYLLLTNGTSFKYLSCLELYIPLTVVMGSRC